jgi:hypothetical protein
MGSGPDGTAGVLHAPIDRVRFTGNPPISRIINEHTIGLCAICGSSLKEKWYNLFVHAKQNVGCIQKECGNYFKLK